jgi:hypothetical protein
MSFFVIFGMEKINNQDFIKKLLMRKDSSKKYTNIKINIIMTPNSVGREVKMP